MKKINLLVFLLSALLILAAACSGAQQTEPPLPTATSMPASPMAAQPSPADVQPTCVPRAQPTPSPEDVALFSPDPAEDWIKGAEDAAITIVEYGDYQCPYCAVAADNLEALLEEYPEDVRLVYRHFPLASIHDKAILATQAAEAAGRQGAFWEMHELLYETQQEWAEFSLEEFNAWAADQAAGLDLNRDQFVKDMFSEEITSKAEATWTDGQEIGIPGTPYIKINNVYDAQADPALLTAIVELIKLEDRQFTDCPPMTIDPQTTYLATLETEKGDIVIELFPEVAPMAVNSFVFLAENDWFDQVRFHRVLEDFIAQTGDPTGTGYGSPGYVFSNETSEELTFDRKGLVAMANSGPTSNGSQFFITYGPAPHLDGGYTIFGEVVDGMAVAENLTPRDPQAGGELPPGDLLLDVRIEEQ